MCILAFDNFILKPQQYLVHKKSQQTKTLSSGDIHGSSDKVQLSSDALHPTLTKRIRCHAPFLAYTLLI